MPSTYEQMAGVNGCIPFLQIYPRRGVLAFIGVNLTLAGRLKPQLYKQNPRRRVSETLICR
ncbi:MAG: hypothetical protein ICV63_03605 [Coleofasciculus sp. Co-bin14]|nr:hypothetical protein [Coleofasciculus sp. Co-bin14]